MKHSEKTRFVISSEVEKSIRTVPPGPTTKLQTIRAVGTAGNRTPNVPFSPKTDTVEFETQKGEFAYEIRLANQNRRSIE